MNYSFLDIQSFAYSIFQQRAPGRPLLIVPYGYTITFSDLDAGETLTQSLSITANADFILCGLRYRASFDSTEQTVGDKAVCLARLLITDSGSNEQFTNSPVDLENYCSNADPARTLPFPRFIQGRTALNLQLISYATGGADANQNIDLFLDGVLVRAL